MQSVVGWATDIRRQRHVGDFRQWKDHHAYQQAFARLLRDLKADIRRMPAADRLNGGEPIAC
jgi:hypothetical protein